MTSSPVNPDDSRPDDSRPDDSRPDDSRPDDSRRDDQPPRPSVAPPPHPGAGHGSYGAYPGTPPGYGDAPVPSLSGDRTWGMVAHLGALGALLFTGFLGFVVPLVVMATRGEQSPFVRRHAVASLNFQLTLLIVGVVGTIVAVVGAVITLGLGLLVIIPAALAYAIFALVVMIKASIRANSGEEYDYPLTLRLVS